MTAFQALFDQAHIKAGRTVVIHGAAGNVGAYAVQLVHRAGVRTIGTAGSDDISVVRELGANTVIDFQTKRFKDKIRDADVVIDLVGGETQVRWFQVLRRGGKLISSVSDPDQHLAQGHGVEAAFFLVNVTRKRLAEIARLVDGGQLAQSCRSLAFRSRVEGTCRDGGQMSPFSPRFPKKDSRQLELGANSKRLRGHRKSESETFEVDDAAFEAQSVRTALFPGDQAGAASR